MNNIGLSGLTWHNASSDIVMVKDIVRFVTDQKGIEFHVGCDSHFAKEKCILS